VPESPRAHIEKPARRVAENFGENIFTEAASRFGYIPPAAHHHHLRCAAFGGDVVGVTPPKQTV
jgi:hypothetical protein